MKKLSSLGKIKQKIIRADRRFSIQLTNDLFSGKKGIVREGHGFYPKVIKRK